MIARSLAVVTLVTAATAAHASTLPAQQVIALTGEDRVLDATFEEVFRVGALEGDSWETLGTVRTVAFDGSGNLHVFDGAGGSCGDCRRQCVRAHPTTRTAGNRIESWKTLNTEEASP